MSNLSGFCGSCLFFRSLSTKKTRFIIKSNLTTAAAVMCLATQCETDKRGSLLITFHMKPGRVSPSAAACDWKRVENMGSRTC